MSGSGTAAVMLRPGDRFLWCGRYVLVTEVELDPRRVRHWRPGRWLHVAEDDGTAHRIHYFDHETVERAILPVRWQR